MRRLIRAQTADGGTIIDFLDDVMQDRNEGFKTHHRISRRQGAHSTHTPRRTALHTPSPSTEERREPALSLSKGEGDSPTPSPLTGEGWGEGDSIVVPAQAEGNPDNTSVVPARREPRGTGWLDRGKAGAHPEPNSPSFLRRREPRGAAGPQHPRQPRSPRACPEHRRRANPPVVPEKSGTQGSGGGRRSDPTAVPAKEPAEGRHDYKARRPRKRRTRTQRRREGNARAAARRKALGVRAQRGRKTRTGGAHHRRAQNQGKTRTALARADPWAGPIDSASPGRSPPR